MSRPHKNLLAQIRILAPQILHLRGRVGHAGDLVGVEAESETSDVDVAAVAGVGGACDFLSSANTANLFLGVEWGRGLAGTQIKENRESKKDGRAGDAGAQQREVVGEKR